MRSPLRPPPVGPTPLPLPIAQRGVQGWMRTRSINFWRSVLVVLATVLVVWASRPSSMADRWKIEEDGGLDSEEEDGHFASSAVTVPRARERILREPVAAATNIGSSAQPAKSRPSPRKASSPPPLRAPPLGDFPLQSTMATTEEKLLAPPPTPRARPPSPPPRLHPPSRKAASPPSPPAASSTTSASTGGNSKPREPVGECHMLMSREMMDPIAGTFTKPVLLNSTVSTRLFSFDDKVKYSHMSMLEKMAGENGTGTVIVAAWQAAPSAPVGEKEEPKFAVEGLAEQSIMWSMSHDGGYTWSKALTVPTRNTGPVWAPVLHFDANTGKLWLFFAESTKCVRNTVPPTWEPGGDLKAIRCQAVTTPTRQAGCKHNVWSAPDVVLAQSEGVDIPKVIANRLIVSKRTKEWVLPFWREQSVGINSNCALNATMAANAAPAESEDDFVPKVFADADAAGGLDASDTGSVAATTAQAYTSPREYTSSGVAVSRDGGKTWEARGSVTDPRATLIEGSLTDMNPSHVPIGMKTDHYADAGKISLWMRSGTSCLFRADSTDGGQTWGAAYATKIVNPNTKSHILRLEGATEFGGGMLAMAFNNHRRAPTCRGCRTYMSLALSPDNGETWRVVASLESEIEMGVRIHYPTLLQVGNTLYVAYSKFYIGRCTKDMLAGKDQPTEKASRHKKSSHKGSGSPADTSSNSTNAQAKAASKYSCLGATSPDQGIRIVAFDLRQVPHLPQLTFPSLSIKKVEPSVSSLESMIDRVVEGQLTKIRATYEWSEEGEIVRRLRAMPWEKVAAILVREVDLDYIGGWRFLKTRKYLLTYFRKAIDRFAPAWAMTTSATVASAKMPTDVSDDSEAESDSSPSDTNNPLETLREEAESLGVMVESVATAEMESRLRAATATGRASAQTSKKVDANKAMGSKAMDAMRAKAANLRLATDTGATQAAKEFIQRVEKTRERKEKSMSKAESLFRDKERERRQNSAQVAEKKKETVSMVMGNDGDSTVYPSKLVQQQVDSIRQTARDSKSLLQEPAQDVKLSEAVRQATQAIRLVA